SSAGGDGAGLVSGGRPGRDRLGPRCDSVRRADRFVRIAGRGVRGAGTGVRVVAGRVDPPPARWRDEDVIPEPLQYDFMQNAYAAGTIVAIVSAVVGFFVVLRGLSFAAHALAHIGFAGATGAVVLAIDPLFGLLAFTIAGGLAM